MALTKREKYIGAGVGAAALLLVLNQLVAEPYFQSMDDLQKKQADEKKIQSDGNVLMTRQRKLEKDWKQIQADGLTDNASIAASDAVRAVQTWAENTGVSLVSTKSERSTEINGLPYVMSSFQVTAVGSMPTISRFVQAIETAKIPVRINEMKVAPEPQREGTDDLKIELTISTLCLTPQTPAAGTTPG